MQTMLEQLRELSDAAVVARERSDDLKTRAKAAKEHLDDVLSQLQNIAYKVSHGLQELPFDGPIAPPETAPPAEAPPLEPDSPESVALTERAGLFRRLVDDAHVPRLSFRTVCRWTQAELDAVTAWLDDGADRPAFVAEPVDPVTAIATADATWDPDPEPVPGRVPQNRRARKVAEVPFTPDPNNDVPLTP
jgi:hypothetical protein